MYSTNPSASRLRERQQRQPSADTSGDNSGYLVPDDDRPASSFDVSISSPSRSHDVGFGREPTTAAGDQGTNLYLHILSVAGVKVAQR